MFRQHFHWSTLPLLTTFILWLCVRTPHKPADGDMAVLLRWYCEYCVPLFQYLLLCLSPTWFSLSHTRDCWAWPCVTSSPLPCSWSLNTSATLFSPRPISNLKLHFLPVLALKMCTDHCFWGKQEKRTRQNRHGGGIQLTPRRMRQYSVIQYQWWFLLFCRVGPVGLP